MDSHPPAEAGRAPLAGPRGLAALVVPVLAFGTTTAAIALPYWTADYETISADGLFGSWILVATALVLGTFLAGSCSDGPLWLELCMLGCAPVAVIGRVVIDTAADPTSHSLWPFEIVLSALASGPPVAIGIGLAWGVRRLTADGRRTAERPGE